MQISMIFNKKYNSKLEEISKHPFIERLRYEGIWYAWAGWQLLRKKYFKKGIIYFIIGIIKWPFRYNRILKSLKRERKAQQLSAYKVIQIYYSLLLIL